MGFQQHSAAGPTRAAQAPPERVQATVRISRLGLKQCNLGMAVTRPGAWPLILGLAPACGACCPAQGMEVEQLLSCRHMFHTSCLGEYIRGPPFDKGCRVCGERMASARHSTDRRLLEERWAHQKAREREVADVLDAFGL